MPSSLLVAKSALDSLNRGDQRDMSWGQGRHLRGLGGRRPPPPRKKKKRKKGRKKKEEKKRKKREKKKEANYKLHQITT